MEKYHGKIVNYSSTKEFLESLPIRSDFIDKSESNNIAKLITNKKPILFLPNDVIETHSSENENGYKTFVYKLLLIGILQDGQKAAVVLNNIKPFMDVKVPDNTNLFDFKEKLIAILKVNKCRPASADEIRKYPFKHFQENESDYIRIYFNTAFNRKQAIEYILENEYEYFDNKGDKQSIKLATASDDKTYYYRKVGREYKFKFCDWNQIESYELDTKQEYCKPECVKYTFKVDVDSFKDIKLLDNPIDIQSDPKKYANLLKDKTMIAVWDIETDSAHPTGDVPSPKMYLIKMEIRMML